MINKQQQIYKTLSQIILKSKNDSPFLVVICGKDASGKTIMADNLATFLKDMTTRQIIRISADDFMNKRSVRRTVTSSEGESCYKYTFNFGLLKKYVLEPLQSNNNYKYKPKVFDQPTDTEMIADDIVANRDSIVIIDGVFLISSAMNKYWGLRILLETSDDIVIERGAKRDTARIGSYEEARNTYINRYTASQKIYFEQESPQDSADIIINNNDFNAPFILKK